MSGVQQIQVKDRDDGVRLDRWFQRHFPHVNHGRLEKLLRTGQVRVDGGRVKANARLETGQMIRVPPLDAKETSREPRSSISDEDRQYIQDLVIYEDDRLVVINKPSGLASQGGPKVLRHVDGLLEGLRGKDGQKLHLVHRLDKDTSGVMVLARGANNAGLLAKIWRGREVEKVYWCLTMGVPHPPQGTINVPLAKRMAGQGGEQMVPAKPKDPDAQSAISHYKVMEATAKTAAWVAVMPVTGRTHQIRAHMAALGTPIVGDKKYGGKDAFLTGNVSKKLHLHARQITLPLAQGRTQTFVAPLSGHMQKAWEFFGFNPNDHDDPFEDLVR